MANPVHNSPTQAASGRVEALAPAKVPLTNPMATHSTIESLAEGKGCCAAMGEWISSVFRAIMGCLSWLTCGIFDNKTIPAEEPSKETQPPAKPVDARETTTEAPQVVNAVASPKALTEPQIQERISSLWDRMDQIAALTNPQDIEAEEQAAKLMGELKKADQIVMILLTPQVLRSIVTSDGYDSFSDIEIRKKMTQGMLQSLPDQVKRREEIMSTSLFKQLKELDTLIDTFEYQEGEVIHASLKKQLGSAMIQAPQEIESYLEQVFTRMIEQLKKTEWHFNSIL